MDRLEISKLFSSYEELGGKEITVCGWIKTLRDSKAIGFMEINDGSSFKSLQVVFESAKVENYKDIVKLNVGAAVRVTGTFILTPQANQPFELNASSIEVEGQSTPDYPLQKKRHTLEYMRTIAHLRPRANIYSAAFRVRSTAAYAIHKFFNERGFIYAHTPLISCSDCEGAGEMFKVTTLDIANSPKNEDGTVDFKQDFFEKPAYLTVSGQLEGEAMALAFGKIYTFGPTFRAEKSYTQRHAAEFWMIEPEIAFADLNDDMELAEAMIKYVISYVMENCKSELEFLNKFVDKGLLERLNSVVSSDFARVTYTDAVKELEKYNDEFDYKVYWGCDLQTEHERCLTERIFKRPVFVTDYPKEIKAFYMRLNDDGKTVAAVDLLVMGIGEISAAASVRRDSMCLRSALKNSDSTPRIIGGILTFAVTAELSTAASASALRDWLCISPVSPISATCFRSREQQVLRISKMTEHPYRKVRVLLYVKISLAESAGENSFLFDCLYFYKICVAGFSVYRAAGHYDIVARLKIERVLCDLLRMIEKNIGRIEFLAEHGHNAPGERELVPHSPVRRHTDYVRRRSETRYHANRHAGDRCYNNSFCVYVNSHSAGCVGNSVDAVLYLEIVVAETLCIVYVLLGLLNYLGHRANGLDGVFARRRFTREHNRARAVIDRIGDIRDLRPGRAWIGYHRFEHLRCSDNALAEQTAFSDYIF